MKAVASLFVAVSTFNFAYATYIGAPPWFYTELCNVSLRASVSPAKPVICGFIVEDQSVVVIRAVGSGLKRYGVEGVLKNPRLTVFRGSERIWSNDDWDQASNEVSDLEDAFNWVSAFPLDRGSGDSATVVQIPRGEYTIHVEDQEQEAGEVLVEVYTVSTTALASGLAYTTLDPHTGRDHFNTDLFNVSTRASVSPAKPVICGFIALSESVVVIRAVGPGLKRYGVEGVLKNPRLTVFRGSERIWSNDDWDQASNEDSDLEGAFYYVSAFPLVQGSGDAATVVRIPKGVYTIHVEDQEQKAGEVLVEVYAVSTSLYYGFPPKLFFIRAPTI